MVESCSPTPLKLFVWPRDSVARLVSGRDGVCMGTVPPGFCSSAWAASSALDMEARSMLGPIGSPVRSHEAAPPAAACGL